MTPLEPDFPKHLMNVLTDLAAGQLDGPEEAYEAIMTHPSMKLVPIAPMSLMESARAAAKPSR